MNRRDLVLAALSTSRGVSWQPVQLQKLFFLLDRKLATQLGGPFFSFAPYDYGPFDATVYHEIEGLERSGQAMIDRPAFGMKTYGLTADGQAAGESLLGVLPRAVREYIASLSNWVRSLSFTQLVSAIYAEFPEMKERSVFRE
jgi:hypothetical protein